MLFKYSIFILFPYKIIFVDTLSKKYKLEYIAITLYSIIKKE